MTGASISLSSVVNPTTYSAVGNTLTYTYTIYNAGTVALGGQFTITANNLNGGWRSRFTADPPPKPWRWVGHFPARAPKSPPIRSCRMTLMRAML